MRERTEQSHQPREEDALPTSPCPKQPGEGKIARQLKKMVEGKRSSQQPIEQPTLSPSRNVLSFRIRRTHLIQVLGGRQTDLTGDVAVIITDHNISGPGGISVMEKGPTMTGTVVLDRQIAEALSLMLSAPSIRDSTLDVRVALKSNRIDIIGDTTFHYCGPAKYHTDYAPAFENEIVSTEKEVEKPDELELVPATPAK